MPHSWLGEVGGQDDQAKSVLRPLDPACPAFRTCFRKADVEEYGENDVACIDDRQFGTPYSEGIVMTR